MHFKMVSSILINYYSLTSKYTVKNTIPGECMGKLFSVILLVHRLLSSGPEELVMDTCTHWP